MTVGRNFELHVARRRGEQGKMYFEKDRSLEGALMEHMSHLSS